MHQLVDSTDERDRQGKSLRRWEQQKAEWDRVERSLATRVGKPDSTRTLQGSTHHFRMRQEELGMIDASVPAEVKNGVSAWEMNLRSSSGGVRYVQVGSSYPYPLYCPIRDAESVKPDNHILMRVLPPTKPAERNKPVSDGEYFQTRQQEFKKHIRRRFSHYASDNFFGIEGAPPPVTDAPIAESADVAPVTFHQAAANDAAARTSATPPLQEKAASRPLSAVMSDKPTPSVPAPQGPMLVLSTAHLHFTAAPSETVQATLRVENTGTTAVFYSWAPCEADATLPTVGQPNDAKASPGNATSQHGMFRLSDVPNGVLLPDDVKFFTVSFRSAVPGVFVQQSEFLTVPAGRERIIVHMRGVVIGTDDDPVVAGQLGTAIDAQAPVADANAMLSELIHAERDNVFHEATVRLELQEQQQAAAAKDAAVEAERARRCEAWTVANAPLGLRYNADVYTQTATLHDHMNDIVGGSLQPWSGGVREFLEDVTCVADVKARALIQSALNHLIAAAATVEEADDANVPLRTLLWRSASRQAFGDAMDRVATAAQTARDVAEGKSTVKAGSSKADKGAAKPGAKKAPAAKGDKTAEQTTDVGATTPESEKVFFLAVRRCVVDAVDGMVDRMERSTNALDAACAFPLGVALHTVPLCDASADKEMEPIADAVAAKGRKK